MSSLQMVWFYLLIFMIAMYSILDGFDLGVGILSPFADNTVDRPERQTLIKSIAPFWDGNEVWLIGVGASLFAVFADAYATILSALYIPLMIIVACLIFRAISIEFRNDLPTLKGQKLSDIGLFIGSLVPSFLFGVIIGNLLGGLPIDNTKNYSGDFFTLLTPYSILIGILSTAMLTIHGAFYLIWRTQNDLAYKARKWASKGFYVYVGLIIIALLVTGLLNPNRLDNYTEFPILFIFPLIGFGAIILAKFYCEKGEELKPFLLSAISIALLLFSVGISLYPNLIPAIDPGNSITVINAASSENSLLFQLVITVSGLMLILAFTTWKYRVFSGKIEVISREQPDSNKEKD